MNSDLLISMAERMAIIATLAYILSQFKIFRRFLAGGGTTQDKILMSVFFGLIAIGGTYLGIPIKGAIANSRVVGAVVAGLLGGPWVGLAAGLIGGVHRYFLGGFTALACGLSTASEGLLAGIIHRRVKGRRPDWHLGFFTGFVAEIMQMAIILLVSRPFDQAWALVQIIGLPMILVNAAGVAIFVQIIRTVIQEEERIASIQTHRVLQIANLTLPYFRRGLDAESAAKVARIIFDLTNAAAVALTDRERVLAHVGRGEDHHGGGHSILTRNTRAALETGTVKIGRKREEIGCPNQRCPLASGVVVPLRCRDQVVGALKLYHDREGAITPTDVEFVSGLASLFATQLELAELEKQAQLATRAELKALRAQINPHFLFNALNTIISFCRTDPFQARELLIHLSDFFRRTLKKSDELVTVEEELEQVEAYLTIERARFGDRLKVIQEVEPEALRRRLPSFTLQPLVENAVKHGLLPKEEGGTIWIRTFATEDKVELVVSDDGVGMDSDETDLLLQGKGRGTSGLGIGLSNVNDRLKSIYGPQYALRIETAPGGGTAIKVCVPVH